MRKPIALTAALAALTLAAPASAAHAAGSGSSSPATATARAASAGGDVDVMLGLINQARLQAGLPALRPNGVLGRAANLKVGRIASCGQFTHTPCGAPFTAVFRSAGWQRGTMGENIAFGSGSLGSPQAILQSWLQSPGHRANLMSRSFRYEGLAVQTVTLPGVGAVRVWVNTFGA